MTANDHEQKLAAMLRAGQQEINEKDAAAQMMGLRPGEWIWLDRSNRKYTKFSPPELQNLGYDAEDLKRDWPNLVELTQRWVKARHGHAIGELMVYNNKHPSYMIAIGIIPAAVEEMARSQRRHLKTPCPDGLGCDSLILIDALIFNAIAPTWTQQTYYEAGDRDFEIMKQRLLDRANRHMPDYLKGK